MNEIEIVVKGRADGFDKVEREAKQAGDKIGDNLGKGLKKAETAAGDARKKISTELDKAAEDAKQSGTKAGSGFGDSLSSSLDGLGKLAGIASAGAALGGVLWEGMQSEFEEDRVGALLVAQTGAASSAAEGLGNMAGSLFANNFGASVEDAGQALAAVFQNDLIDTTAAEADIERLASKVITVGDIMGEEFAAVSRSAQQAVRTGLAESVTEALDMITHATQEGLNNSGELLDTIDEYGTSFREVGINGAEAFGLLKQAQQGGARNIDIAADAIKEFGILTQDTASNAARGFETIGLNGEKMGRMIAAGGEPARSALEQTLNALRAMPPGIERNSAAVDLFGTKAEDLGDALFSMDLDTAAAQFGDYASSVEDATRAMAEGVSFWDKLGKGISNAAGDVGEFMDSMTQLDSDSTLGQASTKARELEAALAQLKDSGSTEYFDELKGKYPELADGINRVIEENSEYISSTTEAADANISYAGTFDDLLEATQAVADGHISLSEASIASQEAIAAAHEAAKEFAGKGLNATKEGFNLSTEAGRELEGSLNDIASRTWDVVAAMREEGATSQQTEGYIRGQRGELIRAARQMGLSESAARRYADRLLAIPKTVKTQASFEARQASSALASVNAAIARIPRSVRTDYYMYTHSVQGGGGSIRDYSPSYTGGGGRAHGGIIGANEMGRAASGGVRSATTMINEAGPEIVELPTGSRVMTAGSARAAMEAGMFGGGNGGAVQVGFDFSNASNTALGQLFQEGVRKGWIRLNVNGSPVKVG